MLAAAVRLVNAGAHCQSVTDEHCARIGGFVTHLPAGGLHAAVAGLCPRMTKPACACLQVKRSTVTPWWWGLRTFIKYRCERRCGGVGASWRYRHQFGYGYRWWFERQCSCWTQLCALAFAASACACLPEPCLTLLPLPCHQDQEELLGPCLPCAACNG